MLVPDWVANSHETGAGWLWLRIGLTAAVALLAGLASPVVLGALPSPLEDDGTPAADYRRLARWRPLPLVAGIAAAVLAGSLVWTVSWALLASVLAIAAAAPLLGYVDIRAHLLPDPVTLAASAVALIALVVACLATGHAATLLVSLGIGLVTSALLLVLALIGGGLGFGDVKLAFVLAATAAAVSVTGAVLWLVLAIAMGGLTALVLVLSRRRDRKAHLPFGPFLLAGWWLALIVEGSVLSAR
jgi:leader peptidase (prepilin peptidase) / N-methyltransferase